MAQYWPLPSLLPALQLQVQAEEARNTTAEDEERPGGGGIGLQLEGVSHRNRVVKTGVD